MYVYIFVHTYILLVFTNRFTCVLNTVDCGGAINACGVHFDAPLIVQPPVGCHSACMESTCQSAHIHTYLYKYIVFAASTANLLPCLLLLFDSFLLVSSFICVVAFGFWFTRLLEFSGVHFRPHALIVFIAIAHTHTCKCSGGMCVPLVSHWYSQVNCAPARRRHGVWHYVHIFIVVSLLYWCRVGGYACGEAITNCFTQRANMSLCLEIVWRPFKRC